MATAAELVTLYKEAIRARLAGETLKGYSIAGRSVENAPLAELQDGLERAMKLEASEGQATVSNNKSPLKMWGARFGRPT